MIDRKKLGKSSDDPLSEKRKRVDAVRELHLAEVKLSFLRLKQAVIRGNKLSYRNCEDPALPNHADFHAASFLSEIQKALPKRRRVTSKILRDTISRIEGWRELLQVTASNARLPFSINEQLFQFQGCQEIMAEMFLSAVRKAIDFEEAHRQ